MRYLILLLCAALALSGCNPGASGHIGSASAAGASVADAAGAPPPAVIASRTVADEMALALVSKAVTAAANGFVALVRFGKFRPGAPETVAIGDKFDRVRIMINAAAQARTATSYGEALKAIAPLLAEIETALAGVN